MTFLENADFFVRLVPLPVGVNGLVSTSPDGTYNVFINSVLDRDRQIDAYFHEVSHIEEEDFDNGRDIREVEKL